MVVGVLPALKQIAERIEDGDLHGLPDVAELRIGIASLSPPL